ncbi:MAG: FtsQ-type POTRA domain-containing protein [Oscillospiraceae bacterium]|jgi:cell division septal protein FtsQ|nr:FtsQ-type POTRA domain-containing protein [Oscillospiraceae bacterium]
MKEEQKRRSPARNRQQRNSRAAQAAQERREARQERQRLDEVREKQKKRAKHRTRRRIRSDVWKRLLIMGGVVAAVVLSMVIFFRVRTIAVYGSVYYTAEEISAVCGVSTGDNLLTVSRAKIAGNIMAELPYISSVRVSRSLPDVLELTVTEYDVTYAICDVRGDYYLMTAGGKITEKIDEQLAKSHVKIAGFAILTPNVGEQIVIDAPQDAQDLAQGQMAAMKELLAQLDAQELTKEIVSIEIPTAYEIALNYADRFYVKLGNAEDLGSKLRTLKAAIAKLEDYQSGTFDLSVNGAKEARFLPEE